MTKSGFALSIALLAAASAVARAQHPAADATLVNSEGKAVGKATVTEYGGHLHLVLHVQRQAPGDHGLHIHAIGLCTPPDFASAGGHWNPEHHQHGMENPQGAHAGDIANLKIGADGVGRVHADLGSHTLTSGAAPLLDSDGASIMIHQSPDDMKTDPSGNSGARIACGVFKLP